LANDLDRDGADFKPLQSCEFRFIPGSLCFNALCPPKTQSNGNLAVIYATCGEKEAALQQLKTLTEFPTGITYGELRQSPDWDRLRGDPRFEKIVASLAPKEPPK